MKRNIIGIEQIFQNVSMFTTEKDSSFIEFRPLHKNGLTMVYLKELHNQW